MNIISYKMLKENLHVHTVIMTCYINVSLLKESKYNFDDVI